MDYALGLIASMRWRAGSRSQISIAARRLHYGKVRPSARPANGSAPHLLRRGRRMHGAARALGPSARARNGRNRPLAVPAHHRAASTLLRKIRDPRVENHGLAVAGGLSPSGARTQGPHGCEAEGPLPSRLRLSAAGRRKTDVPPGQTRGRFAGAPARAAAEARQATDGGLTWSGVARSRSCVAPPPRPARPRALPCPRAHPRGYGASDPRLRALGPKQMPGTRVNFPADGGKKCRGGHVFSAIFSDLILS